MYAERGPCDLLLISRLIAFSEFDQIAVNQERGAEGPLPFCIPGSVLLFPSIAIWSIFSASANRLRRWLLHRYNLRYC